jgi:hypothetical protein
VLTSKGLHLGNMDKVYIYKETKKGNQLKDKRTFGPIPKFDVITLYLIQPQLASYCTTPFSTSPLRESESESESGLPVFMRVTLSFVYFYVSTKASKTVCSLHFYTQFSKKNIILI